MATPTAGWARKTADTLVAGDEQDPLVVLENAKTRADNPSMVGGAEQAKAQLTSQEKTDLGKAWQ